MVKLTSLVATVAVLCLSSSAWGIPEYEPPGVDLTVVSDDVGSGLTRYTYTATVENSNLLIAGMDITFTTAVMNQINPLGNPTIFQDANGFFAFVGADVNQDSQFLYTTSQLTIPAGTASESATTLKAAFVFPDGSPHIAPSVTFAQIVVPAGTMSVLIQGYFSFVPEPVSLVLLSVGCLALLRRYRHC